MQPHSRQPQHLRGWRKRLGQLARLHVWCLLCCFHVSRSTFPKLCVPHRNFDADSAAEGKAAAKAELRARMSLSDADVPLVAVVTRLTHQKVGLWQALHG